MKLFQEILRILDVQMVEPLPYGWFHLLFFALSIGAAILLCFLHKKGKGIPEKKLVLFVSVCVLLLEVYKQINYSFSYGGDAVTFDFQWYAFPFQFCSMPMYVGLLAGLTKRGKIHNALCAFLATYAIFAGLCVMVYPVQVFIGTVGINIQTMICHGSMITVGVYLLYTGYVKTEHKTILKALPVFATAILCAMVMNEIAYVSGLLETDTFNMFFISPHCEPSLPVYSSVQAVVPYPWCLIIYVAAFTLAAYVVLLAAMGIKKCAETCKRKV